jgi:hypothetical protein
MVMTIDSIAGYVIIFNLSSQNTVSVREAQDAVVSEPAGVAQMSLKQWTRTYSARL